MLTSIPGGEEEDGGGMFVGDEKGRGCTRRKAIGRRRLSGRGDEQKCLIQPKIVQFLRGVVGGSGRSEKNENVNVNVQERPKRQMTSQPDEIKGKKQKRRKK